MEVYNSCSNNCEDRINCPINVEKPRPLLIKVNITKCSGLDYLT